MNFIHSRIDTTEDGLAVVSEGLALPIPPEKIQALGAYKDGEVILGIRPDDLFSAMSPKEAGTMNADVEVVQPVGSQIYLDVSIGRHTLLASVDAETRVKPHQKILLKARLKNLHFFDPESENAIC
jgi:multiple sugar transport system ATP-binding protein